MKLNIKRSVLYVSILLLAAFTACEKNDSDENFGFMNIFLPQSTVSGGTDLNYLVPTGLDAASKNFVIDNDKVKVLFSVQRTGKEDFEGFSVTVSTNADTINQLISNDKIKVSPNPAKTVVLLPASAYTLPQTVSVPTGSSSAFFHLSIDKAILKTYAGKKVALAVVISNPTKYKINTAINKAVTIIDVDALGL